jgi:TRAP-type C4-dicarboxylate transport system permease small subunit
MIWLAAAALFGTAFLVSIDVVLRKLVGYSIPATDEVSSYAFAFATSWAYAHVAINNANIRIDFPYMTFPARVRLALDVVAMSSIAALLFWLAYRGAVVVEVSHEMDTRVMNPLRLPLALFQLLWAIGILAGAVAASVALCRMLSALWRGEIAEAERLGGGSQSAEERILV